LDFAIAEAFDASRFELFTFPGSIDAFTGCRLLSTLTMTAPYTKLYVPLIIGAEFQICANSDDPAINLFTIETIRMN
jgi:hypothetical protein